MERNDAALDKTVADLAALRALLEAAQPPVFAEPELNTEETAAPRRAPQSSVTVLGGVEYLSGTLAESPTQLVDALRRTLHRALGRTLHESAQGANKAARAHAAVVAQAAAAAAAATATTATTYEDDNDLLRLRLRLAGRHNRRDGRKMLQSAI